MNSLGRFFEAKRDDFIDLTLYEGFGGVLEASQILMPVRAIGAILLLFLASIAQAQDNTEPEDSRSDSACDPNYTGKCVPIASDVDCAGGGGNGPAYVQGPVRVIGVDIYKLDRDGDGIACDR